MKGYNITFQTGKDNPHLVHYVHSNLTTYATTFSNPPLNIPNGVFE